MDTISQMREVKLLSRKGESMEVGIKGKEEGLYEEIEDFISLIKGNDKEKAMEWLQQSQMVMTVIDEARRQLGVIYSADSLKK